MAKVLCTDTNNDLYLAPDNHLAFYSSNITIAKQLAKNYLWTFRGEIFTNTELGTDYFGIILNQYNSMQDKINELTKQLLTVPYVTGVESIGYTQDKVTGVITFNPTIVVDYSAISVGDIAIGL